MTLAQWQDKHNVKETPPTKSVYQDRVDEFFKSPPTKGATSNTSSKTTHTAWGAIVENAKRAEGTPKLLRPKNEQEILKQFNVYKLGTKTESQILAQVNPNYSSGKYEWTHNCQRCIVAWELLQRGYNVTAKPYNAGDLIKNNGIVVWIFNTEKWWKDPEVKLNCSKSEFKKAIKESFEEWGDGSRAVIRVEWIGGGGHFFTAKRIGDKIVYIDPQLNQIRDIDKTLAKCTMVKMKNWFMRIDNRCFSDLVVDAAQNLEE